MGRGSGQGAKKARRLSFVSQRQTFRDRAPCAIGRQLPGAPRRCRTLPQSIDCLHDQPLGWATSNARGVFCCSMGRDEGVVPVKLAPRCVDASKPSARSDRPAEKISRQTGMTRGACQERRYGSSGGAVLAMEAHVRRPSSHCCFPCEPTLTAGINVFCLHVPSRRMSGAATSLNARR